MQTNQIFTREAHGVHPGQIFTREAHGCADKVLSGQRRADETMSGHGRPDKQHTACPGQRRPGHGRPDKRHTVCPGHERATSGPRVTGQTTHDASQGTGMWTRRRPGKGHTDKLVRAMGDRRRTHVRTRDGWTREVRRRLNPGTEGPVLYTY